jgi:hypothetical protein
VDEREAVAERYGEHLTDADLLVLTGQQPDQVAALRRSPVLVLDLLQRPSVADRVLRAQPEDPHRFSYVSPFLLFAAAVARVAGSLVGTTYVPERAGARTRVPVFDAPVLAAFAGEPRHQLFLAELLASYARLASGVVWRRTRGGWQRRRWDELDLPRLAELLHDLPPAEQPAVWRRLGDGALFLAGIFPEYATRSLGLVPLARLVRATDLRLKRLDAEIPELLEELAGQAYERAGAAVPRRIVQEPRLARRILSTIADRYLLPFESDWLPRQG